MLTNGANNLGFVLGSKNEVNVLMDNNIKKIVR